MAPMAPARYRALQNRINRRTAVRSIAALKAVKDPASDRGSRRLVTVLHALIQPQRAAARELALAYYATHSPTETAPVVETAPYTTAMTTAALARFLPRFDVADTARATNDVRVATAAAMIRHGEQAGREAVLDASARDDARWARMDPVPPCCAFCAVMISRGPVYRTADTGGFESHDHCTCVAVPVFGSDWPGREQAEAAANFYYKHAAGAGTGQQLAAMRDAVKEHGSPI